MFRRSWDFIINIGVTGDLGFRDARRVNFSNYIAALAFIYVIIRLILSVQDVDYFLILLPLLTLPIVIFVLNALHCYSCSKVLIIVIWCTVATVFSYLFLGGFESGTYAAFLAAMPWPFMFFDKKQRLQIVLCIAYVLSCFVLLSYLNTFHPMPYKLLIDIEIVRFSIIALTMAMLLLSTWYFQSINIAAENDLRKTNAELNGALEEITTLRGILPICLVCKKIRDDKGLWDQIEIYISKHSEAEFSHGYCPDCAEKIYRENGLTPPKK